MLKLNKKKAFTLVELIVVITILAILWTIAFLSFQWYSMDARNSARVSDLNNINKALTLNKLRSWRFILPTVWVQITYSGSEVWTQWSFWEDTRLKLWDRWSISKVPVDPLTQNQYTYSVLNTRTEISLATVMEWEYGYNNNLLLDKTYAAWKDWTTYIVWNYNWRIAKVSSWATTYILAVPTIISWDVALTDIITLLNSRKLAFNNSWILPSTYTEWVFNNNIPTTNIVNVSDILVFSWSIETLSDSAEQDTFISNLQDAYSWTTVSNLSQIEEILDATSTETTLLAQNIIKKSILPELEITITSWWGERFISSVTKKTVLDTQTNLTWQSHRDINWDLPSLDKIINDWCDTAMDYCNNLDLDWNTNWRVPSINELENIKEVDWKMDTNYFSYKTDLWYAVSDWEIDSWNQVNFSFNLIPEVYASCWWDGYVRCVHD